MLKTIFVALLSFNMLFGGGTANLLTESKRKAPDAGATGTLEKMIIANGSVSMNLDINRLNGTRARAKNQSPSDLRFEIERDSFFTVLVFNNELRGPLPSSMALVPQTSANLPGGLNSSYQQLVIEKLGWGGQFDLVVRDGKTGFTFFNIEGHTLDYSEFGKQLIVKGGRVLLSEEFAAQLGRPKEAGTVIGEVSISATMRPIEVTQFVDGETQSETLPASNAGTVPGPDVVVGDLIGLQQFGSNGSMVGLAVGTDSCNYGTVNLNWFQNPNNDHPVIPQNMYRMSGGSNNTERFEQIGQSSVKHAFTALRENLCELGCNNVGGTQLGSGCSDPYSANLNAGPNLGSRAWINPFTGFYPRGDSATPNNSHTGHSHTGTSHRILTEAADLSTAQNQGATYYAEAQYITPHEYAWCQSNPGQCNMYNNVSYRKYNVTGTTSFSFSPAEATQRTKPAIMAWTGATITEIRPAPGVDGIGFVAYKVTNTAPGVWHYEYAVYNQNLDRGIQSFSVPVGNGVTANNIGFHAPPQHPGWSGDGTVGNAGFSNTAWASSQNNGMLTWGSESFAQNQNANAIRWGTMYNFRFDSNRPPQTMNAVVGFYKTGDPINVQVQGPTPATVSNATIAGRVTTPAGNGAGNLQMVLSNSNGVVQVTTTTSFGFYQFNNVPTGVTYTIEASSKRYNMNPRTLPVTDNVSDVDFTATPTF